MRLPDLDWPVDLFTDGIMPLSDTMVVLSTGVVLSRGAPMKPTLWADMVTSWIGNDAPFDSQRPVVVFGAELVAW